MNIRETCILINECFKRIAKITGLNLKQINVGLEPDDCLGDPIDEAVETVLVNLFTVLEYLVRKTGGGTTNENLPDK